MYLSREYDVVILGGGTGGYVAAIRAAQLGLKTALVEKEKLGGTCLHSGCIPSKALLKSAEVYHLAKNEAADFGVNTNEVTLDFSRVQERKEKIVKKLHEGVAALVEKGKIDVFNGFGRMLGPSIFSPMPGTISVEFENGEDNEMLILKHLIIATGSKPRTLPGLIIDEENVLSSDGALSMRNLPQTIMIVGGGIIGIEWASMLTDFDVDVTVIEYAAQILPSEDEEIAKEMKHQLIKKGVKFILNAKVLPDSLINESNAVTISAEVEGIVETFQAEKLLVSVGREPNVDGIGLENTEIEVVDGFIKTKQTYQTKEHHIYAIGDVIGGMQLAHVASHEGIAAVEHIAGLQREPIDYNKVARCIYGRPECASIGLTERQARAQQFDIAIGKFPFAAIGKSLVNGNADGFVKIIANKETDDILGIHMIGRNVTELISEAGLAMVLDATPWEIGETIHPHPTLSEIMGEAALAVDGKAIHM